MYTYPKSGIYKILNKKNNKIYIGSSVDIYARWVTHKHLLNKNKHSSTHLQNAWNLYGEQEFEFTIVEEVEVENLIFREQYWLDLLKTYTQECGYNILEKAGTTLGFKHTDEAKRKISEQSKGKLKPRNKPKKQKVIKVRGAKLIGRKYSEEHKRKISQANKNRILSEEHKAKLRKPKNKVKNETDHSNS